MYVLLRQRKHSPQETLLQRLQGPAKVVHNQAGSVRGSTLHGDDQLWTAVNILLQLGLAQETLGATWPVRSYSPRVGRYAHAVHTQPSLFSLATAKGVAFSAQSGASTAVPRSQ